MLQLRRKRKEDVVLFVGLISHLHHRQTNEIQSNACIIISSHDARTLCQQGFMKEVLQTLYIDHNWVSSSTYLNLLDACIKKKALPDGKLIHAHMTETGFRPDILLTNTLLGLYVKCGNVADARRVFDQMPVRNVCSWTVMIAGYAKHGFPQDALKLFHQMRRTGIQANQFTFASVLPACANLASLEEGMEIHEEVIRKGLQSNVFVASALVDMYAKCGRIEKAREVFDKMLERNVFSWTAMIAAYSKDGPAEEALALFHQMQCQGVEPNQVTFASVLPACGKMGALEQGLEIHQEIIRRRYQFNVFVVNALIDMYAKCGSLETACHLFDKLAKPDVVSWTVMIAGYAQNGRGGEALMCFQQMQLAGVKPNLETFACVLTACANLAALERGIQVHEQIIKNGYESNVFVATALVDMYAKCGCIDKARELFDKMHQRDLVSWTTMITGYAMHGRGSEALKRFEQMKCSGMRPDHVTLVSVLSACCHAGLVDEGYQIFRCMGECYNIIPAMGHYSCMVDLLGRAGRLDEAQDFINKMPIKPDAGVWNCLLAACRIHSNIALGECAAKHLFELDPTNATPYLLLLNIYASVGRWSDIEKVKKMMKDRDVKKTPGCSWIEVNKVVHAFQVGDK